MDAGRWRQIDDCYHSALERPVPERAAFLAQFCGNDPDLRREVESLLAHEGQADELLENPAWNHVAPSDETGTLASGALPVGLMMAEYRIAGKLGSGGMGEVYRATDTKLQRDVALKVLAAEFAQNTAWMSRFQREARVLASLNHPHIAAIYGLEESGGVRAIAMELVEGPTLAERIARGRVPIAEALAIARQIAEALEYAHEKGIVHRDLKPANVKLRADGVVKVLDFGLAKAVDSKETPPATATHTGAIMGTPAYMAPEQAAGLPVDRRADIWAFGVVLFEMLAGRQVYLRKTTLETLAAVARDEPQWHELPVETPAEIRRLLGRCLDRNPKNRLRDIGEARVGITAVLAGETTPVDSARGVGGARRLRLASILATVLAVGLAVLSFVHFREKSAAPSATVRFQVPIRNATGGPALSPDGRKVAFVAEDRLWAHFFESGESHDLASAEGGRPFWSPDSRSIGYISEGKVKRIEATGGPSQTIAVMRVGFLWTGATWNQDDIIVFGDRRVGLFRLPSTGGVPIQITALDPGRHEYAQYHPSFLPDGRHFFYVRQWIEGKSAVYLGSLEAKPEQQGSAPLMASSLWPVYTASAYQSTGYMLFKREGTLMAQPFDSRRMELNGQAVPVAEQIGYFSASANNVLAFHRSVGTQLTWYDREGRVVGIAGEPGEPGNLALSPDGSRLAVARDDIWLLDFSRGGKGTRLTFDSASRSPVWSPDGSRIIFSSSRDGHFDLYQKAADGGKDEDVLLKSSEDKLATSWSRDGRLLLYEAVSPKTKSDLWVLPVNGSGSPIPFLVTQFNERQARFSPDGHWVAYTSDESGQDEVYVRSFSENSGRTAVEAGGKWQISNGFGVDPHWRNDGRELFYHSRSGGLLAVEITTEPAFRPGKPQPLGVWTTPYANSVGGSTWDSTADGRRFLTMAEGSGSDSFTVVLNWQAGLKR